MSRHQNRATKADATAKRPRRARTAAVLALAGLGLGCASTETPRDFVDRLTTPNEGVRAELAQLEDRVQELESQVTEGQSENSALRDRLAELEAALNAVRAAAAERPAERLPFEPPPPPRVQVLEVTELDDEGPKGPAPAERAPSPANAASGPGPEEDPATPLAPGESSAAMNEGDRRALYDSALETYRNDDYVAAELAFQRFLEAFPDNDLSDNAVYWIGECRFARGDNRGAMAAFQRVLHEFPLENKVPDALLKVGMALQRMGDVEGAQRRFREVSKRFPGTGAARLAADSLSRVEQ